MRTCARGDELGGCQERCGTCVDVMRQFQSPSSGSCASESRVYINHPDLSCSPDLSTPRLLSSDISVSVASRFPLSFLSLLHGLRFTPILSFPPFHPLCISLSHCVTLLLSLSPPPPLIFSLSLSLSPSSHNNTAPCCHLSGVFFKLVSSSADPVQSASASVAGTCLHETSQRSERPDPNDVAPTGKHRYH